MCYLNYFLFCLELNKDFWKASLDLRFVVGKKLKIHHIIIQTLEYWQLFSIVKIFNFTKN